MTQNNCNADTQANTLFTSLTSGSPVPSTTDLTSSQFNYTIDPKDDLYSKVSGVSLDDLTEVDLKGKGVFDKLMAAVDLHIQREYKGNRITGDQYAKVYTDVVTGVLNQSTQFLLSKEQARWAAITAQMEARIAEIRATEALIALEKARVETQKSGYDMQNASANYALTKMKVANEDARYCLTTTQTASEDFKVNKLLPVSLAAEQHKLNFQLPAQTNLINEQWETQRAQTRDTRSDGLTPITGILGKQKESLALDVTSKQYAVTNTLPVQLDLIKEQRESERAKTLDTRTDGSNVAGSVGKQKSLYDEQIQSFVKDAKHKTAKMYLDGWITQKTLDDTLLAPTELQNAGVDAVLASIRATNNLT